MSIDTVRKERAVPPVVKRQIESARLDYCAICGKCNSVCPSYREFLMELHGPRGRLALINAYVHGEIEATDKLMEAISHCLGCGACISACPAGIRPADAFLWIRSVPDFRGLRTPLEQLILKRLVRDQHFLRVASGPLRLYQRMGLQTLMRRSGLLRILPFHLADQESLLPAYQGSPFLDRIEERAAAVAEPRGRILYFVGCAMNLLFPRVSRATHNLLLKLGYEVITPRDVWCCGAPHLHEGELEPAREIAQHNCNILMRDAPELIITDCASCGAMLKSYAALFEERDEEAQPAQAVALRTRDITEFLAEVGLIAEHFRPFDGLRITYDDPCESRHVQKIVEPPRTLLQSLPGIQYVELPEADWCCGCAGAYAVKHPDMSKRILERKMAQLRSLNVDAVITSNPGCLLQLERGVRESHLSLRVLHVSELLDAHYDGHAQQTLAGPTL
jgi:glycolate oxidase iron-sulfur subunit